MSHWFRGIFFYVWPLSVQGLLGRVGGFARFSCDSLFVHPSPPTVLRTVCGMPPLLFFGKAFSSYVLCGTPPRFMERHYFLLFAPQKTGYGLPQCLGVKKACGASDVSRCFRVFIPSERVFSRWRFFRRAWQA